MAESTPQPGHAPPERWWSSGAVECARCGLAPVDLPDGVDPELVFEQTADGHWYDQGCLTLVDQTDLKD